MARNVKGLIVEIGGDTSGLEDAIKKSQRSTNELVRELEDVNRLLKFNPRSTEILSQKQNLLNLAYKSTKSHLEILHKQYADNEIKLKQLYQRQLEFIQSGKDVNSDEYKELADDIAKAEEKQRRLTREIEAYNQKLASLSGWGRLSANLKEVSDKFTKLGTTLKSIGNTMSTYVTLPLVALGTKASSSAIKFESAFTGVKKTVDGTTDELNKLSKGIRNMAKEIPASTTEIAKIAELAGQLGIKTKDIEKFTRVMIDLGNSTNLSAEEASSALAKFANVTKMSANDYSRLGSTIVKLGNNFATTETDIVNMGTRLGSVATIVGISQAKTMGLATAVSSLGIESEVGATALSKLLKRMQVAVETGSKDLDAFAKASGVSADTFKKAWEEDATKALLMFVTGLKNTEKNGKSAVAILDDMGIKEARLGNAILALANGNDTLANSLEMSESAWEENTALTKEATQRYETLEAKMQITKNKLEEIAIVFGEKLMPYIEKATDKLSVMTEKFEQLSPQTQDNIVKMGLFTASIGPVAKILGVVSSGLGTVTNVLSTLASKIAMSGGLINIFKGALAGLTSPAGIVAMVIAGIVALLTVLYNKCETVRNLLNSAFETIKNSVMQMWENIQPSLQGLMQSLQNLWTALQPLLQVIWTLIQAVGTVLAGAIKIIADLLSATLIPVLTFLINLITGIVSTVVNIVSTILQVITGAVSTVISFFTDTIPNGLSNLGKAISSWWDSVVDFITHIPEKVGEIVQSVIKWFEELPYNMGRIIGLVLGYIVKFGVDALNWVKTNVPKIINGIINFFKELPGKVWTWLVNTITKVATWGSQMLVKAGEIGLNFINKVVEFIQQLPGKVWTWFTNTITKAGEFATNFARKATEGAKNFARNIVDGIKDIPNKVVNVGRNIVEGLWRGITGAGDWIRQKVGEFAKGILDGMKQALGVHSPSVLFKKEIGFNIAFGVGEGFIDKIHEVYQQMRNKINEETNILSASLPVGEVDINGNTTPSGITINFYPQTMTEAELNQAFNYINRRFGTAY